MVRHIWCASMARNIKYWNLKQGVRGAEKLNQHCDNSCGGLYRLFVQNEASCWHVALSRVEARLKCAGFSLKINAIFSKVEWSFLSFKEENAFYVAQLWCCAQKLCANVPNGAFFFFLWFRAKPTLTRLKLHPPGGQNQSFASLILIEKSRNMPFGHHCLESCVQMYRMQLFVFFPIKTISHESSCPSSTSKH